MVEIISQKIEVTGTFTFKPFNGEELSRLICQARLGNQAELLKILHWPKSDLKCEPPSWSGNVTERNDARAANRQIHRALSATKPKQKEQEIDYCLFLASKRFYDWEGTTGGQGYREAMGAVEETGYKCAKLSWFLAFILHLPDELKNFKIAAPIELENPEQVMYPYYQNNRLRFESNYGDACSDLELGGMDDALLFGVKSLTAG